MKKVFLISKQENAWWIEARFEKDRWNVFGTKNNTGVSYYLGNVRKKSKPTMKELQILIDKKDE